METTNIVDFARRDGMTDALTDLLRTGAQQLIATAVAVQAYLLGLPPVNQLANKNAVLSVGPVNKTIPIFEHLMDSRTVMLTPNDNTVYSWFWVDLRDGPLVLEVPPKVLGLIDDMWYHWTTDIGITGADKGEGGKYLLLPPGYKGDVPDGYHVVKCPTYSMWPVWRSFLVDGDPKPGVDLVKKFTKIYPLSEADNPSSPKFVDMSGKPFNMVGPSGYTCLSESFRKRSKRENKRWPIDPAVPTRTPSMPMCFIIAVIILKR